MVLPFFLFRESNDTTQSRIRSLRHSHEQEREHTHFSPVRSNRFPYGLTKQSIKFPPKLCTPRPYKTDFRLESKHEGGNWNLGDSCCTSENVELIQVQNPSNESLMKV